MLAGGAQRVELSAAVLGGGGDSGVAEDHRPRLVLSTLVVLLSVRQGFWHWLWTCESPRPGRGESWIRSVRLCDGLCRLVGAETQASAGTR